MGLLAGRAVAEEKPNIIFFLADDQRNDTLGCAGNPIIQSPTLDRLAARGVRFENAFCEVPICSASRATLLSGLTQRTHGFNFFELPVPSQYIATSYPMMLKAAGYRIGFAGKYGMQFGGAGLKKEFDFIKEIGRNPFLKKQEDGTLRHETDLCADAAIEFIKSNPQDKPFCMSVSFNATHAEDGDHRPGYHFQWPQSADGLYEDVEIPAPKLSDDKYFKAMPPFLQDEKGLNRQRYYWRWNTPEKYQTNIRAYYRMITGIDNAIARVLKELKAKGLDQNTIIVYSADNGYMRGDRGTAGKWNHYDQSLRIPLIVYDPRLPEEQRGRVVNELVNNVDLPATFVDFAGLEIPEVYQGRSVLPLVEDKAPDDWRKDIFTEHKFSMTNNWYAVRSERYKYASYYQEEGGPYECLYDLGKDPTELINLANNPEYATVLSKMKARMNSYLAAYPEAKQKDRKGKSQEVPVVLSKPKRIYSERFDGDASKPLDGRALGTDGVVWQADPSWQADGVGTGKNAYIPFMPESGKVYTLSFEVEFLPRSAGWLGWGFMKSNPMDKPVLPSSDASLSWILLRSNEAQPIETFLGPRTAGKASHPGLAPRKTALVLNTTQKDWTVEWLVDGTSIRGPESLPEPPIGFIGIGSMGNINANLISFDLSVSTIE